MRDGRAPYEKPAITGEQEFETRAVGCGKVPGLTSLSFCGVVWGAPHGHQPGCFKNPTSISRSS